MRDRLAKRLVGGLWHPLLLLGVAERETAEPVARALSRRLLLLLALRHRPVADRTNRLAQHCGTHRVPLLNSFCLDLNLERVSFDLCSQRSPACRGTPHE